MSCIITLKDRNLRLTRPRRLILDYIHDKGGHFTAEEIIEHVHEQFPGINKSTIYRTLELLERNDCVVKSVAAKGTVYHHAEEGHHHHLVCRNCGASIDCDEDTFLPVEEALERRYGFKTDLKHMVISGLCKKCRSK